MEDVDVTRCSYCHRPDGKRSWFVKQTRLDAWKIPDLKSPICGHCFGLAKRSKMPPHRYSFALVSEAEFDRTIAYAQSATWAAHDSIAELARTANMQMQAMEMEAVLLMKRLTTLQARHTATAEWKARFERHVAEALFGAYQLRRKEANAAIARPLLRLMVFQRDGFKCVRCNAEHKLSIDHIVPVRAGGVDEYENYQTLCKSCNSSKGKKLEL